MNLCFFAVNSNNNFYFPHRSNTEHLKRRNVMCWGSLVFKMTQGFLIAATVVETWLKYSVAWKGSSIKYVRKIFRKTNISNLLIGTRTCAYQGVRDISFSWNFAYVLNWCPQRTLENVNKQMPKTTRLNKEYKVS